MALKIVFKCYLCELFAQHTHTEIRSGLQSHVYFWRCKYSLSLPGVKLVKEIQYNHLVRLIRGFDKNVGLHVPGERDNSTYCSQQ